MESKERKAQADLIADEIMQKMAYFIRHKLDRWPKESDIRDMHRIVKSILIQHKIRENQSPK
jgi:hypothetical protein